MRDGEREPIGALVKVSYSDGRVIARRYGSTYKTAFSQVLGPLRFGVREGVSVAALSVRWPGEAKERVYPAPELGRRTPIERD